MNLKDYTSANTQISLAKLIGVAPSFVNQWVNGSRPVPVTACVAIERVTNGAVTRQELRPDDYWLIWPDLAHLVQPTDSIDLEHSEQERREIADRREEEERREGARRAEEVAAAKAGKKGA